MIRYIAIATLLFTLVSGVEAQKKVKIKFVKNRFESPKSFRLAKKCARQGKSAFKEDKYGSYLEAADYFKKAYELEKKNAALNYFLGVSLLRSKPASTSLKYLESAYWINKDLCKHLTYALAKSYQINYEFDKAITKFNEYKNKLTTEELGYQQEDITKKISECRYGKQYMEDTARVFVTPLKSINSEFDDFAPVIPPDGKKMYFSTKRFFNKHEKVYEQTGKGFENVFWAEKSKRVWKSNGSLHKRINTSKNNAVVGLSPNGQNLIIFDGKKNNGDLALAEYKKGNWKSPNSGVFDKINTHNRENSATIAYDDRTLYFISDRYDENKIGGLDIFMATRKNSDKKWKKVVNLGPTLNTKYDEEGLFLHPGGQVLYFSSKGHTSMGGYDLFKSEKQPDGSWGTPVNLGYPINTPGDDLFFGITANGRYGYYSSRGPDGDDFDIYEIIFLGPEKPLIQSSEDMLIASIAKPITETVIEKSVEIKTIRLTIVKGKIFDNITNDPIQTEIEITDNEADSVIMTSESGEDGNYLVSLPSGKNYAMTIKAKDYLFHSENFNIPPATNYQEIIKDIKLNKLAAGSKVILSNIFFEYGKSTLRTTSYPELNRVVELLNAYPKLKIEISGHTDNKGSLAINTRISEKRAKAVVEYIIGKGIGTDRLKYKGYAYLQPVASNDTEDGRQRNRRVEFKILSNK